jgi:NADPH:quinone reductase
VGLETFGDPDVLNVLDLPDPVPTPGRAVVRVFAATVNPTDTLLRAGQQAASMTQLAPPYIPGMEFAGHVHALGEGATELEVGQPVMGVVNPRRPEGGAQAELLSVPFDSLLPVVATMDLVEAATIPMNGLTALKAIEVLDLGQGGVVLATGGAGALGGYVIQLAKHAGLTVIADAKDADRDFLARLDVDHIVPRGPAMARAVRDLAPNGLDGLIDAARIGDEARALVRDGGVCVSVRGLQGDEDTRVRHHAVAVGQHVEDRDAISQLGRLVSAGVLTPRVARRLPIERAAEAHRLVEAGGLRGRVVLTF